MKTRNTVQRLKILDYLRSVCNHPTAQEVYEAVVKHLPTITLATVYRNLNLLAAKGEIVRFEINNEYRYDAEEASHQHCLCRKCSKIMNVRQKEISEYAMDRISISDFSPSSVFIIYNGVCNDCGGK